MDKAVKEKLVRLKAMVFDIIVQEEKLQVSFNTLEKEKRALAAEIAQIESVKETPKEDT